MDKIKTGPTVQDEIRDYEEMIKADAGHLTEALASGHRVLAHGFVDSIIDNKRLREDLITLYS